MRLLNGQNSAVLGYIVLPCSHQAGIRLCSHRLLQLDDKKPAARHFIHRLDARCFNANLENNVVLPSMIYTISIED